MLYLGVQMNLYTYFPHFLTDVSEIQSANRIMLLSKWKFHNFMKINAGKAKLYSEVQMKFWLIFYTFFFKFMCNSVQEVITEL